MNTKRKKTGRRVLSFLLTLAMVLGLLPGMGLTALAWDGDPYAELLNTTTAVNFDGKEWYLIENNSTAGTTPRLRMPGPLPCFQRNVLLRRSIILPEAMLNMLLQQ